MCVTVLCFVFQQKKEEAKVESVTTNAEKSDKAEKEKGVSKHFKFQVDIFDEQSNVVLQTYCSSLLFP